jgi:glycosyltransferase involved in cell wall biosynthesis
VRRILQVTAYYPPHLGGQENVVQDLATALAASDVHVEVLTSNLGAKTGTAIESGVRVTRLRSSECAHTALLWALLPWLLKHASRNTILHLHVGQAYTPEVVWLASRIKGFQYVLQMHIDPVRSGKAGMLLPFYRKVVLRRAVMAASAVLVLNDEHRVSVESEYGRRNHVLVVSNGMNDEYFAVERRSGLGEDGVKRLLFVGRLSPQKNLHALLEAVVSLKNDVQLHVVGDGECRTDLEKFVEEHALSNVVIHGTAERREILRYYAECDALVLPSLYEAQPLVLLEAMAARLPVIATNVRGIREIGSGIVFLVEPNAHALRDGIWQFIESSDEELRTRVEAGYKKANAHRWSNVVGDFIEVYGTLDE